MKKALENKLVSIIIPVYNKLHHTKRCVKSILKNTSYPHYEVIIIDNASSDGTAEYLAKIKAKHDSIQIISNKDNQGFARASNQGAKHSKGKHLLFLNNDTKVLPNWMDSMVEIIENDPSVSAVGSKLLFPDKKIQHAGVIVENNKRTGVEVVGRHIYYNKPAYFKEANQLRTYQVLTAACLLVRRTDFEAVGMFNEEYWNGYEDVDLCFKLGQREGKLVYQPNSVVIHYESQSGPERFSKVDQNVDLLQKRWKDKIEPDAIVDEDGKISLREDHKIRRYTPPGRDSKNIKDNPKIAKPVVSIIILTYNALEYTKKCLASIKKNTTITYEIILVDNNSSDGTQNYLRNLRDKSFNIKLIENEANKGFAAGNNQGMAIARGEYILLLNNDVLVSEGWLYKMVRCARTHDRVGLVGPLTNRISGTQMIENVGYDDPDDFQEYAQKIENNFPNKYTPRRRIAGFAMLIKREVYDAIGDLDERFGSGNYEDDDYCLRAIRAGYKIYVAEDTFIHHFGSRSFVTNNIPYHRNLDKNRLLFKDKWPVIDLAWLHEKDEMLFTINDRSNQQAIQYINAGKTGKAQALLLEVLENDPINTDALFGLSIIAKKSKQPDRSIKLLKQILQINPNYHHAYNLLGKISFEHGSPDRAYNLFRKTLRLEPGFINARRNIGIVLTQMGKTREAIEVFESLAESEKDTRSLHHLIKINSRLKRTGAARKYAKMLIKQQPDNKEARVVLRTT